MRLNKGELFCIYFACQFNPLVFYFIVSSGGYGITGVRFLFSILVSMIFFATAHLKGYKLTLKEYLYVSILLVIIIGRAFLDLIIGIRLDISAYIIYLEYVFVYLVVAVLYTSDLNQYISRYKNIILLFMFVNFCLWAWSLTSGTSWGIFRAFVSGITINRLPDFINLIIVPWIFATSGGIIASAVVLYAIATSYRTLYLAMLVSLISLILFGNKFVRRNILKNSLISVILFVLALSIYADGFILIERVFSLFTFEANVAGEGSKSQRVVDFVALINSLPNCVFVGCGSVDPLTKISYYNFPYYPIWTALIFGPFSILFNLWIFLPIFLKRTKTAHNFLLSIWAVLLIIVLVFPYLHYFCLVLFISLLQVPIVRGKI